MGVQHEGAPAGVGEGVALAPPHLLAGVVAARAARLGVRTLSLSITAALGLAPRPDRSRSAATRAKFNASHAPASRSRANQR